MFLNSKNFSKTAIIVKADGKKIFSISECITADCPELSAIYVYNKYTEVVYSTRMRNADVNIPLPKGGYIIFADLDGDSVSINYAFDFDETDELMNIGDTKK